ncbi:hypothetical protein BO82DRAFT_337747, partial [Aspergillus uvarum CBS 121591]
MESPPPIGESRPEVGDWVKDIIRRFTQNRGDDVMNNLFLSDTPNFEAVNEFFGELNQHIHAANLAHGQEDIRAGEIPAQTYQAMYRSWRMEIEKPEVKNNPSLGWKAYDQVYQALNEFNKAYNLPLGWNISPTAAETVFGHRPPPKTSLQAASVQRDSGSESSEDESIDDDGLSGIDLLETRARQQSRSLVNAKVLFWWSKGAGTQIFVRYGPRSNPIFRIRAGTHEYYDKKTVTRVLVSKTRGYMKKPAVMDGILGETWKYERKHVSDILGVGWKIEDDDESRIDPLALIEPATGVMYPETRVFVAWKDGEKTLETRAFIRRIANGSNLDGDRLIFQKAKELE